MPARKHEACQDKYTPRLAVKPLNDTASLADLLYITPRIIAKVTHNMIISKHGITWGNYKPAIIDSVGYIVCEKCERCGKVVLAPGQRKLREINTELGPVYMDTGICKDCINASIYVDKFLDGDPLSETDAKKLFYEYARQYERQWRITLATAPRTVMTKEEWQHRCNFFGGCALCGGEVEVQHKYFPTTLNGSYTPWNIIPLCYYCDINYKRIGKVKENSLKAPHLYRVFSTNTYFQKTKTIRLFLLAQMELHSLYMDNLLPFRERFMEKKILPYSVPYDLGEDAFLLAKDLYKRDKMPIKDTLMCLQSLLQYMSLEEAFTFADNAANLRDAAAKVSIQNLANKVYENRKDKHEEVL